VAELWDKFLVLRRDGTVPNWPYLVIGARDPSSPAAIRALADDAEKRGKDRVYVADLRILAEEHDMFRVATGEGDPDAGPHREDDPDVVSRITYGTVAFRKDRRYGRYGT
jgi:hypothetical protein